LQIQRTVPRRLLLHLPLLGHHPEIPIIQTPSYLQPCQHVNALLSRTTRLRNTIAQLYILQGFRVTTLTQHATDSKISRLPHGRFNVIVSEYTDAATFQHSSHLLTANGKTFPWTHFKKGLQSLLVCDPWLIGHANRLGSEIAGNELKIPMSDLSEIITVMPGDSVHVKKDLFSD
jgi:hypothetical protein